MSDNNLTLFPLEGYIVESLSSKRIRYNEPTYTKFYSIYQYDRNKFRRLLNEQLKGNREQLSQNELIQKCLIKDELGNLKKDSDEAHIFRIRVLHRIYSKIYDYLGANVLDLRESYLLKGFRIWNEEKLAEIPNTEMLPIKDRVKLHIKALRKLKG